MTTTEPVCGKRHAIPGRPRAPRPPTMVDAYAYANTPALYTPPCVEPAGHKGPHCAEDGTEWEATP